MLELLGEHRFRSGTKSRIAPDDKGAEHWIAWDDSAAVCTRRCHPATTVCDVTTRRLTVMRVLEAGAGTRFRLEDGREWAWADRPATHVLPAGTHLRARFEGDCAIVLLAMSGSLVRRAATGIAGGVDATFGRLDDPNPIVASLVESVGERCRRGSTLSLSWVRCIAPVIVLEILAPHGSASDPELGSPLKLPAWRLKRLDDMIEASLDERIPLTRMAEVTGLSLYHFARTFRNTLGLTPQAYVQLRRCEKARSLMDEGRMTLSEIALVCGFSSQSHFTTVFKRIEGVTPGQWRGLQTRGYRMADAD